MRGYSIVELMVGLYIGLVAVLAMYSTYVTYADQARTTTSSNDAEQNGAIATFFLERALQNAGHNLSQTLQANKNGNPTRANLLGCSAQIYRGGVQPDVPMVPILITDGGSGAAPDQLTVVSGNGSPGSVPVALTQAAAANAVSAQVADVLGFNAGDFVLVAEANTASTSTCVLRKITSVSPPPSSVKPAGEGSITFATSDPFNAAGLGIAFSEEGSAVNLGLSPRVARYSVQDGHLEALDLLANETENVADDVVNIQAQYGVDNLPAAAGSTPAGDGVVDAWVEPTGTYAAAALAADPASVAQIKAVRIAVVVRSKKGEKNAVSPASLNLYATNPGMTLTLSADQQKYRYKVFETVVPIINMVWSDWEL
jgi:type IV pilus assembly protein PilW